MQPNPPRKIKIIITDDHQLFRKGVRAGLERWTDIDVIGEAENGKDLLEQLELKQPDMILLDLQMPVMDGLTALPLIRQKYPLIKVIMLSMHNDSSVICRMLELGASTYLTLEAGAEQIREAIMALTQKWFYINETVERAIRERPQRGTPPLPFGLSEKEVRLCELLDAHMPLHEMAITLDLSPRTVQAVIDKVQAKCGVKSTEELLHVCRKNGIIK